jgi:hypothetical protein
MDTAPLVEDQIAAGRRLVAQLLRDGFDVTAAWWAKTGEEGRWFLYIASKAVDERGPSVAYRTVLGAVQGMPNLRLDPFRVKLVGATSPITRDVLGVQGRFPGKVPIRYQGVQLGGVPVEEVYIYPPGGTGGTMDVLAQGKDEVLQYLEREAQARTGTPGNYFLARDDAGRLVAVIAGHGFVGTGTITLGGSRLVVVDGLVVNVEPPQADHTG